MPGKGADTRVSLPFSRYSKHIQQFTQQGQRSLERPVAVHGGHVTGGKTAIFKSVGEENRSFCFGATQVEFLKDRTQTTQNPWDNYGIIVG